MRGIGLEVAKLEEIHGSLASGGLRGAFGRASALDGSAAAARSGGGGGESSAHVRGNEYARAQGEEEREQKMEKQHAKKKTTENAVAVVAKAAPIRTHFSDVNTSERARAPAPVVVVIASETSSAAARPAAAVDDIPLTQIDVPSQIDEGAAPPSLSLSLSLPLSLSLLYVYRLRTYLSNISF